MVLWIDLISLFVVQDNGLNGTGLGGEENHVVISALWINNVGLVLIIQLKDARRHRHAGSGANAKISIDGDFGDFERFCGGGGSCGDGRIYLSVTSLLRTRHWDIVHIRRGYQD